MRTPLTIALCTLLLGGAGACGDEGPAPDPRTATQQQVRGPGGTRDFTQGKSEGSGGDFGEGKLEGGGTNFSVGVNAAGTTTPIGASCGEACQVLLGCGFVISDCVPSCEAGGLPTSTLRCIVNASCDTAQNCF